MEENGKQELHQAISKPVLDIAHISQQRTNGVGVLFFKLAYFFSTGNVKGTALSKVYSDQI